MAKRTPPKKRDALDTHAKEMGIDPDTDLDIQGFSRDIKIAELIYAARIEAGLTQNELAKKIGTVQQVISQLENSDYEGHSISMLERIAEALHKKVEVRLVPDDSEAQPA